jgi:hypothetical protein
MMKDASCVRVSTSEVHLQEQEQEPKGDEVDDGRRKEEERGERKKKH